RAANACGSRGSAGGVAAVWLPQPARRTAALLAAAETGSKRIWQSLFPDFAFRAPDVVFDAPEPRPLGGEVEEQERRARVAVPRLAHRARVQEPTLAGQIGFRAGERRAEDELAALRVGDRDVAVPDEDDLRRDQRLWTEHVLPDGMAGARMEELDACPLGARLEPREVAVPLVLERRARPPCGGGGLRAEVGEVDVGRAEHPQVVVPCKADRRTTRHRRAALVRARPVPDQVAQAPHLVRLRSVDRVEHGLERVEVSVDVRDDGDAHARRTIASAFPTAA